MKRTAYLIGLVLVAYILGVSAINAWTDTIFEEKTSLCRDPTSSNRDDLRDAGNLFFQLGLNTHLESHLRAGTTGAGPLEADLDNTVIVHVDQFDITAIGLQCGPYLIQGLFYLIFHCFLH